MLEDLLTEESTNPQMHLFSRLMMGSQIPHIVYHYTDAKGLAGILRRRHIWATDVRYLNDSAEFGYAIQLMTPALNAIEASVGKHEELFSEWRKVLSKAPNVSTYVVSFSSLSDSLPQWRAYSRPYGFALGLDHPHLISMALASHAKGHLLRCIYDPTAQQEEINHGLRYLVGCYSDDTDTPPDDKVTGFGAHFFGYLLVLAGCLKHPAFAEEKEWRLILREVAPGEFPLKRKARAGLHTYVPYAELPIGTNKSPLPLAKIVIGPCLDFERAADGLSTLLDETGVEVKSIVRSDIPFRDW
jgi:hypothetical protein